MTSDAVEESEAIEPVSEFDEPQAVTEPVDEPEPISEPDTNALDNEAEAVEEPVGEPDASGAYGAGAEQGRPFHPDEPDRNVIPDDQAVFAQIAAAAAADPNYPAV